MTTLLPPLPRLRSAAHPTRPAARLSPRLARHLPQVLCGLLLLLTAAVRLINLTGAPQRIDDEGTYVAQAYAVLHYGELAHYTYWYDHPPLGWLQIAAWFLLTGGPGSASSAVAEGRGFMVVVAVVSAALLWTLARRLGLSLPAAVAAVAVFALSPLAVDLGRIVYLDNIATAWLLAALVLFCSPQQRLSAALGGAACFGIAVLTKETMLLLLPAVLLLAWTRAARATRRYAAAVVVTVLGLMLAGYVLTAAIRSELLPGAGHVSLLQAIEFQLYGRDSGGSLFDPHSLNRATFGRWWALDPVLLTAALPAAAAALAVRRLQPVATGVVLLAAILLRDGYLPAPFVIAALPLVALLVTGVPDAAVRWARAHRVGTGGHRRPLLVGALAAAVTLGAVTGTAWAPTLRYLLTADADAPLRQAEQWISENVPHQDRLVVDDALWVDLVSDGRDRRDVVWFYKLDTDTAVQSWSPDGWRDYDWVVSSPSLRAGTPSAGQLADAVAASAPVAVFGSGDARVELRHVQAGGSGTSATGPGTPAASLGAQLADHLDGAAEPALAVLRSGGADPRVLTTLDLLAARERVLLSDLPTVPGEDAAGAPRRQVLLRATGPAQDRIAAFFRAQSGTYAPDAVETVPDGLLVRFPAGAPALPLPTADPATAAGPSARVRVADLRTTEAPEVVDVFGIDGRPVGVMPAGGGTPSGYRSLAPGEYVLATRPAADGAPPPVARQVVQVQPGRSYTFALFTDAARTSVNAQLVPDEPGPTPAGTGQVRLIEGARAPQTLTLTIDDPHGPDVVLADGVGYGLVTGYAQVGAGRRTLTVHAGDQAWPLTATVPSTTAVTLVLREGPDGPALTAVPDSRQPARALDRPARP
jgi:Dolichyl-phosphate-mannose-protein mannosyltransferase/Domain of unknown function (DUF4397)